MSKYPNDNAAMAARGWPDGRYQCICSNCGQHFHGHKRALECRLCEEARVSEMIRVAASTPIPPEELERLRPDLASPGRVEFISRSEMAPAPTFGAKELARVAYEQWCKEQPQPQVPWNQLETGIVTGWRIIVGEVLLVAAPFMTAEIKRLEDGIDEYRDALGIAQENSRSRYLLLRKLRPHRVRHKKTGGTYEIVGDGKMQSSDWHDHHYKVSADMRSIVIYRSEKDGSLWARPKAEFEDGRFEELTDG